MSLTPVEEAMSDSLAVALETDTSTWTEVSGREILESLYPLMTPAMEDLAELLKNVVRIDSDGELLNPQESAGAVLDLLTDLWGTTVNGIPKR